MSMMDPEIPTNAISIFQTMQDRTHVRQFLMKFRPDFEHCRAALLNHSPLPTINVAICDLLAEEQRLLALTTIPQFISVSNTAYGYKKVGHLATTCKDNSICGFCRIHGHTLQDCRKKKRVNGKAYLTLNNDSSVSDTVTSPSSGPLTPEMIKQIVQALSVDGLLERDLSPLPPVAGKPEVDPSLIETLIMLKYRELEVIFCNDMDRNKPGSFKKRSHSRFKKKWSNKKRKRHNFSHEQNFGNPHAADTVYRILCPARKIGDVIGKSGSIIKALRAETHAKIGLMSLFLVGCLLGKGGNIIQKLRSETGASIRILPADHLPACAMSSDELVQISGISAVAKRAYEVTTLLHQNPRKDNPLNYPLSAGGQGFYPLGAPMANLRPRKSNVASPELWCPWCTTNAMDWGYGNQSSGFFPGSFNGFPAGNGGEASGEFSMKIMCSAQKIGVVIGMGGCNITQLQQETGANIHVEDTTPESDERVILISSFEGGHVITEMRRRTQADIRVSSKDDIWEFNVAKDALSEIASRLRVRILRDANAGGEPAPVGPFPEFGPSGSFPGRGRPPSGMIETRSTGGYEHGGGHEYEAQSYLVQLSATGYPNVNNSMEVKIPNNTVGSIIGTGGSNISNLGEISGRGNPSYSDFWSKSEAARFSKIGGSECVVEIHGSSEQMNAAHSLLQIFAASAGQNFNAQQGSYQY
ncbi:hypothetical protein HHK36_024649 [Tetracentron sinense]|uniref:K Homology domain-containing protein n=1 Tax=Tetracentron sinense TaxID=13715 RepID=A0A834YQE7_TETSI|nr:hypothetical protein HHK36_024649 [Tetracentron sinense]